jgi:predicted CoA-binding protein
MEQKKAIILVIGASENPARTSYTAVLQLQKHGYHVIAVGNKRGKIGNIPVWDSIPDGHAIGTVTLYIRPEIQGTMETQILSLKPRRIIFNPGTENESLAQKARALQIKTENACTLVLLSLNQFN